MKFLLSSVIVALVVFFLGGWLSNGFLPSEIFWPWALVSAFAGAIGSLNLL